LIGTKYDFIDILNIMGVGYVFRLLYGDICDLCKRYSRGNSGPGKGPRDMIARITKTSGEASLE
jgi:hypothetical protein